MASLDAAAKLAGSMRWGKFGRFSRVLDCDLLNPIRAGTTMILCLHWMTWW